jgi:hypothetical protein
MSLTSRAFKGDPKLEDCALRHPAHIVPGSRGPHVGKIQKALVTLGAGAISASEIASDFYGATTTAAVRAFKTKRDIINRTYQNSVDDIVGIMTITALDKEMYNFENRPPEPINYSFYVALTDGGEADGHDHSKCKTEPYVTAPGKDGRPRHTGTPINPQRWGRMINIGGEAEAVGFDDFLVRNSHGHYYGPLNRPFTEILPSGSASDICMRSAPLSDYIVEEIMRIAAHGCRFTFAGDESEFIKALWMGILLERHRILTQRHEPSGVEAYLNVAVVLMLKQ